MINICGSINNIGLFHSPLLFLSLSCLRTLSSIKLDYFSSNSMESSLRISQQIEMSKSSTDAYCVYSIRSKTINFNKVRRNRKRFHLDVKNIDEISIPAFNEFCRCNVVSLSSVSISKMIHAFLWV